MRKSEEMEFELDALYLMAVLKLQYERQRLPGPVFQRLLADTLSELKIDPAEFEAFVASHRQELELTLEAVGF